MEKNRFQNLKNGRIVSSIPPYSVFLEIIKTGEADVERYSILIKAKMLLWCLCSVYCLQKLKGAADSTALSCSYVILLDWNEVVV